MVIDTATFQVLTGLRVHTVFVMPSLKRTNSSSPSACSHSGKRVNISLDADLSDSALLYERGIWRRFEEHAASGLLVAMASHGHRSWIVAIVMTRRSQVSKSLDQTCTVVSLSTRLPRPTVPVLSLQTDACTWSGSSLTHLLK